MSRSVWINAVIALLSVAACAVIVLWRTTP